MNLPLLQGTAIAVATAMAIASPAAATTFTSAAAIAIPASGTSGATNPFPSTIAVIGSGVISSLTVDIFWLSHTFPGDIFPALVGPTGTSFVLMSDTGGGGNISNVNLTFDDTAAATIPSPVLSGTFQVSQLGDVEALPAPAPAFTFGNNLSASNGTDANGAWSLFVFDDAGADTGSISGGWGLIIETAAPIPLPASLPLLLEGLGAFGLMRRRSAQS